MAVSLLTVVETSAFARRAVKLLTADEYAALIFYLALYREKAMKFLAQAECASFAMKHMVGASPAESG